MIKLVKSTFYREDDTKASLTAFIENAEKLSAGERVRQFETEFAAWQERSHAVMFNSGSSANLALIQALLNLGYLSKGDRVAFSAVTWATNVMPLIQHELTPVPIDVTLTTLNTSPELFREALEREPVSCLFVTNLLGFADDLHEIRHICAEAGVLLLEDNCESLGSSLGDKKLGNFGLASTFSFFVGHHMSTIEGGAVCTDDTELADMLRMVRAHGWDRDLSYARQERLRAEHAVDPFEAKYTFYTLGYNLRPTEIQGFLGSEQLQYLDEIVTTRAHNFDQLRSVYENPDLYPIAPTMTRCSNFALPVITRSEKLRTHYLERATTAGIETRPIVGGLITEHPFFQKTVGGTYNLPNARTIHTNGFYVGNNPELTDGEITTLIETLRHG
jgi:CDP-6-deoxy-D-xylo-4-hexulose-3-dehydrase